MVDVTSGRAYLRASPLRLRGDIITYVKTEFGGGGVEWIAGERAGVTDKTPTGEPLHSRLLRGKYSGQSIVGTTRRKRAPRELRKRPGRDSNPSTRLDRPRS